MKRTRRRSEHLLWVMVLSFVGTVGWADSSHGGQQRQRTGVAPEPPAIGAAWELPDPVVADLVVIRLAESSSLGGLTLSPTVAKGVVTLEGDVPTEQAKRRALRIVSWTPGVQDVRNRIAVDPKAAPPPRPQVPDDELAAQVARTIAQHLFPKARASQEWLFGWEIEGPRWQFAVDIDDGEARLTGQVPTFHDIRRVVEAARLMAGVRTVHAQLYPLDQSEGGHPFRPGPNYGMTPPGYGYYGPYPPVGWPRGIGHPWPSL